ncbi:MAG: hypothetical protein ACRDDY_19120 [Clostridium sp.]|uniref:hypothetical protein n=1 Tax=Clostridium sp. TaxID=1506 RepID=UPI003EE4A72E
MKKTILLNLSNLKIKGDVLDFSIDEFSLLDFKKEEINTRNEIALTVEDNYDTGILFFNLNKMIGRGKKEEVIERITNYIKKDGEIYIWDLNKNFGEIVDVELKVLCPNDKFKNVRIKTNNIFSCLNIEEIEKILEKNCIIEETKVWEDIFYIKAKKIN